LNLNFELSPRREESKKKASSSSSSSSRAVGGDGDDDDDKDSVDSDASDSESDSDYGSDDEDEEDDNDAKGFIEKDEAARDFQKEHAPQGGIGGNGMRVTVRNLRLREDTPKYLRNLALDSAFYDPKSRSMRLNPLPDENPEDLEFAGDNFVRHSGDALKLAQNQVLCWEMQARGENVDVISNPSQAEMVQRQFVEKKKVLDDSKRRQILDKYLDGKANVQMDPRLKLGQTESYVEYGKDGKVLKGAALGPLQAIIRTKYDEDVLTNSHTCVWGSYFNLGQSQWGYKCCHSLLRASYCTGKVGREANDAANGGNLDALQVKNLLAKKAAIPTTAAAAAEVLKASSGGQGGGTKLTSRSDVFGDSSASAVDKLDPAKLKAAYERANGKKKGGDTDKETDDRKRGYNSMETSEVTIEDMEVYRAKKVKADDPMAAYMGDSEVLLDRDTSVKNLHSNY
jgi:pre-mRNA-processing factor SLU7